ncbi:Hypothetical predicted protein [Mytilus galloprovincialis]|uniref:NAD(P)(+)--arginine ADP-ribosyltransferase n=1 Tax=Mytilus galloprovincialis TaxID=29158 RepID=A0A8B6EDG0_MYTGA|nr:Hypothetical predicted protein [Mytilus galloprovincialis]
MGYFTFATFIIISLLLVDFSSERIADSRNLNHLKNSRYKRNTFELEECGAKIAKHGIDLINFGIKTIYNDVQSSTVEIRNNFYDALHNLYQLSGTQPGVRQFVTTELYKFKNRIHNKEFKDYSSFNEAVIHFYTTYYAYREINTCLREHQCITKSLTQNEEYLAPYSAVLMSVLLYWPVLKVETGTTYRGIHLEPQQIDEFIEGLKFTWPSFISSSRNEAGASFKNFPCIFVFDNSEVSLWSPKRIAKYAYDPNQDEALYPPGVQFQVIRKQENADGKTRIYLKLITSTSSTSLSFNNSNAKTNILMMYFIYITCIFK